METVTTVIKSALARFVTPDLALPWLETEFAQASYIAHNVRHAPTRREAEARMAVLTAAIAALRKPVRNSHARALDIRFSEKGVLDHNRRVAAKHGKTDLAWSAVLLRQAADYRSFVPGASDAFRAELIESVKTILTNARYVRSSTATPLA